MLEDYVEGMLITLLGIELVLLTAVITKVSLDYLVT